MKLTQSMELTKRERKKNIWLTVILGIMVVMISQAIAIQPSNYMHNGGVKEVYVLFSNIVVIISVLLFTKFFEKRSIKSVGFNKQNIISNILKGFSLGFLLIFAVFVINLITGSITISFNIASISWIYIVSAMFGYLVQGTMEEVVCRGFIMNSISAKYNVWLGVLINSIIFAILHGLNASITPLALINLFMAGLILSFIFYLSDNIFLVGAFHAAWNFSLGPIFGVPVSGLGFYSSLIHTNSLKEASRMNGGTFGFEGGLALTISGIVALAIIYYIYVKRTKKSL